MQKQAAERRKPLQTELYHAGGPDPSSSGAARTSRRTPASSSSRPARAAHPRRRPGPPSPLAAPRWLDGDFFDKQKPPAASRPQAALAQRTISRISSLDRPPTSRRDSSPSLKTISVGMLITRNFRASSGWSSTLTLPCLLYTSDAADEL